jgi:hypothetical protein
LIIADFLERVALQLKNAVRVEEAAVLQGFLAD